MVKPSYSDQQGQAVTEYILMMAALVSLYLGVTAGIARIGLTKKLMNPITKDFAAIYQFGHPKAKGFDNGGPEYLPHAPPEAGQGNFRIFINKKAN